MPTPNPPRPVVAAEDTRMQRDRLQSNAKREQAERTGELSMITATATADEANGIFDGQNGALVEPGLSDAQVAELARRNLPPDDDVVTDAADVVVNSNYRPDAVLEGAAVGPNGVPIETAEDYDDAVIEVPDLAPVGTGARPARPTVQVDRVAAMKIVRVNASVTPTIGQGENNTWDFQEGKRYRVPEHVANHLAEKGLVSQWG